MSDPEIKAASGRPIDELTMEALLAGELSAADLSISAETLRHQADAADAAGYREFAQNLRRAAELSTISNQEVLEIYRTLRPGRTTYRRLMTLAAQLEAEHRAPLTAALVREAAEIYLARGLIAPGDEE